MWPFCRERPNRPNSPRRVLLMFREVSTCDPTIFGPNRPLIGAHLREQDAIATESLHPGFGVHWIDFDSTEDPGTPAQPFVWVAVKAGRHGPGKSLRHAGVRTRMDRCPRPPRTPAPPLASPTRPGRPRKPCLDRRDKRISGSRALNTENRSCQDPAGPTGHGVQSALPMRVPRASNLHRK